MVVISQMEGLAMGENGHFDSVSAFRSVARIQCVVWGFLLKAVAKGSIETKEDSYV